MPKEKLTVYSFDLQITIDHPEYNSGEIKRNLDRSFNQLWDFDRTYSYSQFNANPVYEYLNYFISSFGRKNLNKIYLTNYEERIGSYEILAQIIIISVLNYGSIRETMDYLKQDLQSLFKHITRDGYSVRVSINSESTIQAASPEVLSSNVSLDEYRNEKLINRLSLIAVFLAFVFLIYNNNKPEAKPSLENIRISDQERILIKEIIKDEIRIYDLERAIKDTSKGKVH